MKRINNVTGLNAIMSIFLQIIMILNGFVIPKIILNNFGSEVNGLIASLTQALNYISLLEGGVNSVILASLYKPVSERDVDRISAIVKTSKLFFRKIGYVFFVYAFALMLVYPIVFDVNFNFAYISTMIIIIAFTLYIQNNFSISLKLLLTANKKIWIVHITQIILVSINMISFIVLSKFIKSIHVLKLVTAIIFIFQPIIYNYMVTKMFKLKKDIEENQELLKNRWSGFAINIAAFIHYNTDITVLTLFADLKTVSVYSVYSLVSNGLRSIVIAFSSGITPTLGQLYAKEKYEELNEKLNLYEYILFFIIFLLFSVGAMLIGAFVSIYTTGINDANYNNTIFGILIIISEGIYCIKEPYVSIAYIANKFKDISKPAYIEAIINILLSIILVNIYGLIGVAIGTLVAMCYRTIFHVKYLQKNVIYRDSNLFLDKLVKFSIATLFGGMICQIIPINFNGISEFVIKGVTYCSIMSVCYLIMSIMWYKKEIKFFTNFFIKFLKK